MTLTRAIGVCLGLVGLVSCAPMSTTTVALDPTGALATCPAPAFSHLVGQRYDSVAVTWSELRVIRPHDLVTKDFRPARFNIELDEAGVITRVFCG
ncbi:MAG: I78 family peptidase inhibitor [Maritimibacter sp.]